MAVQASDVPNAGNTTNIYIGSDVDGNIIAGNENTASASNTKPKKNRK